jgi:hypothetical protein
MNAADARLNYAENPNPGYETGASREMKVSSAVVMTGEEAKEVREFLARQRAPYTTDAPRLGIIKAKLAVMAEVRGVAKDRVNKHQGYEFTGHDDVTEALQDAFVKYGIAQSVSIVGCTREMDGMLLRLEVRIVWTALEDGSQEDVISWGEATVKNKTGRPDGVEVGQALSYAVKVASLKNFMLVGGLVPDPEETDREPEPQRRPYTTGERNDTERPSAPKEPPSGIAEEELQRWIGQYGACNTREELQAQHRKVANVIKHLSREQHQRLGDAALFAEERIEGK